MHNLHKSIDFLLFLLSFPRWQATWREQKKKNMLDTFVTRTGKEGRTFLFITTKRLFEFHWSYFWSASLPPFSFTFGISHPIFVCITCQPSETQSLLSWKQFFVQFLIQMNFFWELNIFKQVLKSRQCFMVLLGTVWVWWLITVSNLISFVMLSVVDLKYEFYFFSSIFESFLWTSGNQP